MTAYDASCQSAAQVLPSTLLLSSLAILDGAVDDDLDAGFIPQVDGAASDGAAAAGADAGGANKFSREGVVER